MQESPDTLIRKQNVYARHKNGSTSYHMIVPREFGEAHDLEHNREVLVEYGEVMTVRPLKRRRVAST
jgi:hypothetical protein